MIVYLGVAGACAEQAANASTPLSLSISSFAEPLIITVVPGASPPFLSNQGEIASTATASGGTTPYTYAWTITEIDDPDGAFAINAQGTTNAATYDTAIVETTFTVPSPPAPPPPAPIPATYEVECNVTDGASNTATATYQFTIEVG